MLMGERTVDDRPTTAVDDRRLSAGLLATALEDDLVGEGWGQPVHDFRWGSHGVAFKHAERFLRLYIVDRPGRPVRCDLACDDARVYWSVMILGPTVGGLRAAVRAATTDSSDTEADLVVWLRVAGWDLNLRPDRPRGSAWAIRPDRRRYVVRGTRSAGGWSIQGDGIDVDASGGTPFALVAALALS